MTSLLRYLDYIFLLRPVLFYPIWTVFLAGFVSAGLQYEDPDLNIWWDFQRAVLKTPFLEMFFAVTLVMGASFILNQIMDISTDRKNKKLFLLSNQIIDKKTAWIEMLMVLSLGFILVVKQDVRFWGGLVILFIVTGPLYSAPPFSWKDRPICGLLVNLAGGILTFCLGWQASGLNVTLHAIYFALSFMFAIGAVYFLTTVIDESGDKEAGKITFAVRFGQSPTIRMAVVFEILCLIMAVIQKNWIILIPAILALPFFVRLLLNVSEPGFTQAVRVPILLLSLAVASLIPTYLLLIAIVFVMSRWYYRRRFQISYPRLTRKEEVT